MGLIDWKGGGALANSRERVRGLGEAQGNRPGRRRLAKRGGRLRPSSAAQRRCTSVPVHVQVVGGPYPPLSRVDLRRRARAMLAAVQLTDAELSIVLTGDDQIQNLNEIYRKKNRPTDVLAFAMREGDHGERAGRLLGDVVVSVPTARRQAAAAGRALRDEMTMLLAHGLLH